MQIDKYTISVLKHFSSINPVLLIREGNVLISGIPNIIKASATLDISFPKRFALENVAKFINILEMFKEPNVEFLDNMLTISGTTNSVLGSHEFKLMYTDENIIEDLIVPDRQIQLPSIDISLKINSEMLPQVMKALKVLGLSEIHFYGDGDNVFINVLNSENPSSDTYSLCLGKNNKKFRAAFKAEYFSVYPNNYDVEICKKGIARFTSERLEYFVTMNNNNSYFED
jgi:hypothetical protein